MLGPGLFFKENSKCLALLQEENKCAFGLSHLAKKVLIAQLSVGTTCVCTDLGNARCPSKRFLPVTWETKGFQMQDFNIKEGKGLSPAGSDITGQLRCLSVFLRAGEKRGNRERTQQRGFLRCRGVLNLPASSREQRKVWICQKNPSSHLDFPLAGSSSSVRSSFKGQRWPVR